VNQNAESTAIVFARATHMPALDDGSPGLSVMKASSKNCWSVTDHLRLLDVIWLDVKEDAKFSDDERLVSNTICEHDLCGIKDGDETRPGSAAP